MSDLAIFALSSAATGAFAGLVALLVWIWRKFRMSDAYIYVPEGMVTANFRYQDLPMKECAWCGKKVNLQRHHVISWAGSPELKDDPDNIVVLCGGKGGGCHKCLGHGHNYHRFNANLKETLKTAKWVVSDDYYKETHEGRQRTEIRK